MVLRGFSGCLFKQAIQQKTYLKKGSFLFSQSLGCFIKYLISNCFLAKALTRLLWAPLFAYNFQHYTTCNFALLLRSRQHLYSGPCHRPLSPEPAFARFLRPAAGRIYYPRSSSATWLPWHQSLPPFSAAMRQSCRETCIYLDDWVWWSPYSSHHYGITQ